MIAALVYERRGAIVIARGLAPTRGWPWAGLLGGFAWRFDGATLRLVHLHGKGVAAHAEKRALRLRRAA